MLMTILLVLWRLHMSHHMPKPISYRSQGRPFFQLSNRKLCCPTTVGHCWALEGVVFFEVAVFMLRFRLRCNLLG